MRRTRSDPALKTRREVYGRPEGNIGHAVPGYMGHVPGMRHEDATYGCTFARSLEASRGTRSRATYDTQQLRKNGERAADETRRAEPRTIAPAHDKRGMFYPAAGDTQHSRIRASGEDKDEGHFHSSMGLTSSSHEDRGAAERLRSYGRAARGVPGYCGYVPGKIPENIYSDTWSKTHEKSLGAHFDARLKAPNKYGLLTAGGTLVSTSATDGSPEEPIFNTSYHDRIRGWSNCQFSGCHVDPAGRLAPRDRQEGFQLLPPPNPNIGNHGTRGAAIHGYMGWVPGRVGESVVGERQCKTNAISDHLFDKQIMRITQR